MNDNEFLYTNEPTAYTKVRFQTKPSSFIKKYRLHFFLWTILILNETLAAGLSKDFVKFLPNYISYNTLHICLFYMHSMVILPYAFQTGKHILWKAIITILAEIISYFLIAYLLKQILPQRIPITDPLGILFRPEFLFSTLWRCFYFLSLSTGLYFLLTLQKTQLAKERAEKEILKKVIEEKQAIIELSHAKNAVLKARVNPHFLFNALNKLYAISRHDVPLVAKGLLLISKIMRFSLQNSSDFGFVTIANEIDQVEHLIKFGEIEHKAPVYLSLHCDEQSKAKRLIPLVLITLVENMLKHGDLSQPNKAGKLDVTFDQDILTIRSWNLINQDSAEVGFNSGLNNIKERLKFEYGDNVDMKVSNTGDIFEVNIDIKLL